VQAVEGVRNAEDGRWRAWEARDVGSSGACLRKRVRSGGSGAEVGPQGPSVHVKGALQGVSGAWPAPQGASRSPNPWSFMRCRGRKPRRASSGRFRPESILRRAP
jgi:hypothetical protein